MAVVVQAADSDTLGLGGKLSFQLTQAAQIEENSEILFKTATGFVWGVADPVSGSPGEFTLRPGAIVVTGNNLTYGADGKPNGGTVTGVRIALEGTVAEQGAGFDIDSTPMLDITGLAIGGTAFTQAFILAFETGNSVPIENIFFGLPWNYNGSAFSDFFHGFSKNDTLFGNDDRDELFGGGGDNKLYGGAGDDFLRGGGPGKDYLSGGTGRDVADYSDSGTGLTVSLNNPALNTGNAAGDTYNSIENLRGSTLNDTVEGNAGANVLDGNLGNDTLRGLAGGDRLAGSSGNDTLIGGTGGDELQGSAGIDTASYKDATTGVTASLANASLNKGEAAGDSYAEVENLIGSAFDDLLFADNGVNVVSAGNGDDQIRGYRGNDTLAGGSGKDTFVFNSSLSAATNVDTIVDYLAAADTIHLDNAVFTALTTVGPLSAAAFRANTTGLAGDATDRIIYETDTGKLFYDFNGNAAGGGVHFATLSGAPTITAADFVVV
jgi:Ca2+-binding RTX toxin-like protein